MACFKVLGCFAAILVAAFAFVMYHPEFKVK
jgi:hypothetical protein